MIFLFQIKRKKKVLGNHWLPMQWLLMFFARVSQVISQCSTGNVAFWDF